jgi:formamidopyrimidine-DNA glycosylase
MPELPEVETMCRGLAAIAGCRIADLHRPRTRLKPIQIRPSWPIVRRRLLGQTVRAVSRLGKRVVLELAGGDRLVIEPRMTGLILPGDPPNRSHLRLVIDMQDPGRQLLFWDQRGLGVVQLLSAAEFQASLAGGSLGPDALGITPKTLRERLSQSRRPIKVALLDQRTLAGVGNLYASEILHRAGLHPGRPCCELRRPHWLRLHAAMQDVLGEAVRCEGSTLGDGTYRLGRRRTGGYQVHHRVYMRAGKPCLGCGRAEIVRIVQAQRSTFFCPVCQPY